MNTMLKSFLVVFFVLFTIVTTSLVQAEHLAITVKPYGDEVYAVVELPMTSPADASFSSTQGFIASSPFTDPTNGSFGTISSSVGSFETDVISLNVNQHLHLEIKVPASSQNVACDDPYLGRLINPIDNIHYRSYNFSDLQSADPSILNLQEIIPGIVVWLPKNSGSTTLTGEYDIYTHFVGYEALEGNHWTTKFSPSEFSAKISLRIPVTVTDASNNTSIK